MRGAGHGTQQAGPPGVFWIDNLPARPSTAGRRPGDLIPVHPAMVQLRLALGD